MLKWNKECCYSELCRLKQKLKQARQNYRKCGVCFSVDGRDPGYGDLTGIHVNTHFALKWPLLRCSVSVRVQPSVVASGEYSVPLKSVLKVLKGQFTQKSEI